MANRRIKLPLGQRFGRLVVVAPAPNIGTRGAYTCRCDCGKMKTTRTICLQLGQTRSCGCLMLDELRARRKSHGISKTPLYHVFKSMHRRCSNPNDKFYRRYGGRGITVCERWNDLSNFIADMSPRPAGTSLDRIDNDEGYSPENCRWTDKASQARNRSKPTHLCPTCGTRF